jgi:hypothetical protein
MAQEMVQISQAQLMTMMGFQKQYIDEKEKKMSLEDDLKKSVSYLLFESSLTYY